MLRRVFMAALGALGWDPLVNRLNRFASVYNGFVEGLNRGVFDARLARRLSHRWRDVETCGQWPKENG